jgi:hypothetical protein
MNRVPFDQLLRGVQDSRDPSGNLGLFGNGSEKLKRIEKLEDKVAVIADEFNLYKGQVQEMGRNVGDDLLAIRELKADMEEKVSYEGLQTVRTQTNINMSVLKHELTNYIARVDQKVMSYPDMMKDMANKQTIMSHALAHQIESIIWLKDAVRALRDNNPLPPYPHEYKQSLPDKKTAIVPYKAPESRAVPHKAPENSVVPFKRWPTNRDAPLYIEYPGDE